MLFKVYNIIYVIVYIFYLMFICKCMYESLYFSVGYIYRVKLRSVFI